MKKVLLGLIAFIAIFTLSCEKNPTNEKNLVNVKLNVEIIGMEVTSLKSATDDPFGVVEHAQPYWGSIAFFQPSDCNQSCIGIDCFPQNYGEFDDRELYFQEDIHIMLTEGYWQVTSGTMTNRNIETDEWTEFNLNKNNWILPCLKTYKVITEPCQSITMELPFFNMTIVPTNDCIAIYDPADLFESLSIPFSDEITSTSPYLKKYSENNLIVGYVDDFLENDMKLKLNDGRSYILPRNDINRNEFYPMFVKISIMPPSTLSVDVISYNDTISYIY